MRHKPVHTHTPRRPDSWHTPDSKRRRREPAKRHPLRWHNSLASWPTAGASPGSGPRATMRTGRIIDRFEIYPQIHISTVRRTHHQDLDQHDSHSITAPADWLAGWLALRNETQNFTARLAGLVNHIYSLWLEGRASDHIGSAQRIVENRAESRSSWAIINIARPECAEWHKLYS